ncbi:glycosyl hydrolase family 18 protein [Paenibacillus caseinilyticus]|uniref:glycosyl hydrolase family 18 protein n=1 Tax=Paenibacillus caseinilyticus TaxID=3098138 RepID=UPI0022B87B78|nr:glycosyl hydrolase family 18 protein [Paenibacillus caseinilyticus]MCZ8520311.1 glycosyl hydrolase family 18 protein [Paenibacillus caseinilyticus]
MAAALFMLVSTDCALAYDVPLQPFGDITNEAWFQDEVYSLSALGMIDGYPDGTYRPDGMLTREAFLKLFVSAQRVDLAALPAAAPSDVKKDRWSYAYVAAAYERQWIDFMLDDSKTVDPERVITREEVAAVAGKALLGAEPAEERSLWLEERWKEEQGSRAYPDSGALNGSLAPYIYYAVNKGVMEGDQAGFHPKQPLTRKEAAAIVYRLLDAQLAKQKLAKTGFYAIRSYPALQRMPLLDQVTFGWSHLEYSAPGVAKLNTETTEYKIPSGWEEAVKAADDARLHKELMVYYGDSNLKEFLRDEAAQGSFIESLKKVAADERYGFDGICMDLEGLLEPASAADYVRFLTRLKEHLPKTALTVAVQPDYYYKGYDLKEIGRLADTVILMAYNFTHDSSRLPSAPLPLVADTVKRTLAYVPKEKLVLGISKQANQWVASAGQTQSYNPEIAEVEKRLAAPGVTQYLSYPYGLRRLEFQDERGAHEVFYEDASSIGKKLWLAKYYGLKGVSLWYMGNYTESDWQLFKKEQG